MSKWIWILPLAALALILFRNRGAAASHLQDLVRQGAQKVDVRTPAEFAAGHAKGSVNIPLDQLNTRAAELDKARPVLLCCASGARSGMGTSLLKDMGFNAVNAGPWTRLRDLED